MDEQRTVFVGIDVSEIASTFISDRQARAFCVLYERERGMDAPGHPPPGTVRRPCCTGGDWRLRSHCCGGPGRRWVAASVSLTRARSETSPARWAAWPSRTRHAFDAEVIALFAERVRPQARPLREPE